MVNLKTENHNSKPKNLLPERCFNLSVEVIGLLKNAEQNYMTKIMAAQLLRSTTSIGANITEAKSSSSKREFIHYYTIALRSANETKYWLKLIETSGLLNNDPVKSIYQETFEISNIIASSLITMKGKRL